MNKAIFKPYKNSVSLELVRISSDWTFIAPTQVHDLPKERDK